MDRSKSLIEQFNEQVSRNVVADLFKAMRFVRRGMFALVLIVMITNYTHQASFFADHGAGRMSIVMPAPLDVMMILFMKISSLKGIPAQSRKAARYLLLIPALASATASFAADGDLVVRITFAFFVASIALGDFALSLIRPDFAEIEKVAVESVPVATKVARRPLSPETKVAAAEKARTTREANARSRMTPAQKRADTIARRRNAERMADEMLAAIDAQTNANAPVSPAVR